MSADTFRETSTRLENDMCMCMREPLAALPDHHSCCWCWRQSCCAHGCLFLHAVSPSSKFSGNAPHYAAFLMCLCKTCTKLNPTLRQRLGSVNHTSIRAGVNKDLPRKSSSINKPPHWGRWLSGGCKSSADSAATWLVCKARLSAMLSMNLPATPATPFDLRSTMIMSVQRQMQQR